MTGEHQMIEIEAKAVYYRTVYNLMLKCFIIGYDDNKYVLIKFDHPSLNHGIIKDVKFYHCHWGDDISSPTLTHEDVTGKVPLWCGGY